MSREKNRYCEVSTKLQVFPSDSELCRNLLSSDSSERSSEVSSRPSASPGLQPSSSPFHSINTQPFPTQSQYAQGQAIYRPTPSYNPAHFSSPHPSYNPYIQREDGFHKFSSCTPDFSSKPSQSPNFPPPPPSSHSSLSPVMSVHSRKESAGKIHRKNHY